MPNEPDPLEEHELAALRRMLRELGLIERFEEVACDFAERDALALEELSLTTIPADRRGVARHLVV
jgi:hypothetical protein